MPVINRVDGDTELVTQGEVKAFNEGLSCRVFDCCRFAFDIVAAEKFLKFLADKFAAIVVSDFGGTRVATQPVRVELDCTGFGVGGGDQG